MRAGTGVSRARRAVVSARTCVLVDATWAVVGVDPVSEVHAVLARIMNDAVPGLEGRAVGDALIGRSLSITGMRNWATPNCWTASAARPAAIRCIWVPPKAILLRDVLQAGLTVLAVLTESCVRVRRLNIPAAV